MDKEQDNFLSQPSTSDGMELLEALDSAGVRRFKVGVFDVDGVFRGKYMSRAKFASALEKGFGFCDVVLGWDSADELYDSSRIAGWHTGYRDAKVALDPSTARLLTIEDETALVIGEFQGDHAEVCPRNLLRRVSEKASSLGFVAHAAAEY
ncbi:MAG: glutamine synthetase, partial [Polyangiaceae bacterium]|nr:glutamine synthetase [Polyangiaceae bacterium]